MIFHSRQFWNGKMSFDPFESLGCFVDIYSLIRSGLNYMYDIDTFKLKPFEPDVKNIIFITLEEAYIKKIPTIKQHFFDNRLNPNLVEIIELACCKCNHPALFIRKINNKWLCPSCSVNELENINRLRLLCCDSPAGCDSCGGIVKPMLEIPRRDRESLLLCARNQCVMPFGYAISIKNLKCSCEIDSIRIISNHLIDDITNIIRKYMGFERSELRHPMILGDLTISDPNWCLPCQIAMNYKFMDWEELLVDGHKRSDCRCFKLGSLSDVSRSGKDSDFTPVSTPNLLRRKSSGDLSDVYTPSTSSTCASIRDEEF